MRSITESNYLYTIKGTVVYVDAISMQLRHGSSKTSPFNFHLILTEAARGYIAHMGSGGYRDIKFIDDRGYAVAREIDREAEPIEIFWENAGTARLKAQGLFLCAEPGGEILLNRTSSKEWERFRILPVPRTATPKPQLTAFIDPPFVPAHELQADFDRRQPLLPRSDLAAAIPDSAAPCSGSVRRELGGDHIPA